MASNETWSAVVDNIVNCILHPIIGIFGIASNLFCLCVFIHFPRFWAKIRLHLILLMIWDSINLLGSLALFVIPALILQVLEETALCYSSFFYEIVVAYIVSNTALFCTILVTLSLATERYMALCHPMFHTRRWHKSTNIRLAAILPIIAILFTVPRMMEVRILEYSYENTTFYEQGFRNFVGTQWYQWCYRIGAQLLFISAGPVVVLGYFTIAIAQGIANHDPVNDYSAISSSITRPSSCTSRNLSRLRAKRTQRANIVSCVLLMKSAVCHTLPAITDVIEIFLIDIEIINTVANISNILVAINSAVNLLIFLTQSSFRKAVRKLLGLQTNGPDSNFTI